MRFKININREYKHKEICSGVNWRTPNECFRFSNWILSYSLKVLAMIERF